MCRLRLSLLESETLYTYGVLFVICGIVAAIGNLIALYILISEQKSKSNIILSSLAVSDTLTGFIVFPLNAYQSFTMSAQSSCTIDIARSFFALAMIGSSVLTLVVIAVDRYILMTRFPSYHNIVTKRRVNLTLSICWLFPAVVASLRIFSSPSSIFIKIYEVSMLFIFFGPVLPLAISYCLLIRLIYTSRKRITVHAKLQSCNNENLENTEESKFETVLPRLHLKEKPTKSDSVTELKVDESNLPIPTNIVRNLSIKKIKFKKRHLKLAKSVAILLGCYILCLIPFNIWIVLDLTKRLQPYLLQQFYMFGIFAGAANSCINPFIYLSKKPGFQKRFRLMFKRIIGASSRSSDSDIEMS